MEQVNILSVILGILACLKLRDSCIAERLYTEPLDIRVQPIGCTRIFAIHKTEEIMRYYCEDKDRVLSELGSGKDGLTAEEAGKRLAENGKNRLAAKKKKPCKSSAFCAQA